MRTIATRLLASAAVASALVVLIILAMPKGRFWLEFIGYAVVAVWLVGAFVGCVGLVVIYAKNAPTRRIQRGLAPKVPRAHRREAAALASLVEQWPAVVERIKVDSRVAWLGLKGSRPGSLHDGVLTVIAGDPGRATNFPSNDRWLDLLRECIREVTGLRVDVTVFDSERVTGARDGASQ
jgi:hypothetical protein